MASRILLADDSITIQKVVNLTFADEGIEVVAVSNGDVAERRLAEVSPDLVLADIFMPGKNGYELCEAIKENSQFRNVPVVLLVGAFEPFDQVEARRVRADAHLTKPFESRTLVETVRRLIGARGETPTGPIAPILTADDEHEQAFDALAGGTAAAPLASQLAGKLDLSAMMVDSDVAASTPPVRNTGELASPSPDAREEALDVSVLDAPSPDAVSATLTDTSERFEPLEFSPNGDFSPAEIAPPFDLDMQDFQAHDIQDLVTTVPVETAASQDPISFESGPSTLPEVDISGAGEGEHWFNPGSFETTKLDRPSGDATWRAPATGSPLSYESPDFRLQTESGYSVSEASTETACATLLAVDEPLGDVLFDEGLSVDPLAPSIVSSGDSLSLEFTEPEVAEAQQAVSTQFDLVETVANSSPEASSGVEEEVAARESLTSQETPPPDDRLESTAGSPLPDAEPTSHDAAGDLNWTTPRAAAYSTAQLDSVVMPMDAAEFLAANTVEEAPQPESTDEASFTSAAMWTEKEAPQPESTEETTFTSTTMWAEEEAPRPETTEEASVTTPAMWTEEKAPQPERTEEASFTTPAMWTEEEARFTPIDIEAVSVKEASAEEISAVETASAFSPTPTEQAAASVETPVASGANGHADEAPEAGLSSAAIEQIVRRVVAEMSESVVREIAWDVVPDCVERVIEQLTRESLSKRA